jgi:hypothetical protein
VPELTLRLHDVVPRAIRVGGVPLRRVEQRAQFASGTWLVEGRGALLAFDPQGRREQLAIEAV